MPRVKCVTPKSLKDGCIDFIVSNMDLWCKQSANDLYTIGPQIGSNPFDQFPCEVLEQIARICCCKAEIETRIVQHLLTPQLTSVVLPWDQETLKLASMRCPQLRTLRISIFFWAESKVFPKFEKLQILDFSGSGADDTSLHTIGTHCADLRVLNVNFCRKVTDYGIQGLCLSVDNMGRKSNDRGRSKSIQSLVIRYKTGVTKKGVLIALENLPDLRNLDHVATVEVLAEIAKNSLDQNVSNTPKFALSILRVLFQTFYKSGHLGLALSLCPWVTNVLIEETKGFAALDLLTLKTLNRLQKLNIEPDMYLGQMPGKITFNSCISPLLKDIGDLLKELELSYLEEVSIQSIAEFCPNIENFSLIDNSSYSTADQKVQKSVIFKKTDKKPMFEKLKMLRVEILKNKDFDSTTLKCNRHFIPREILISLLSSPLLCKIEITDCDILTDHVLLAASKIYHFANLEELFLQNCNFVTEKGIDVFMQEDNVLKQIELTRCEQVSSEKNLHFWKIQAKQKNWELMIFIN